MVTVNEAKQRIIANTGTLPAVQMPLSEAIGSYLSEDVISPIALPPFRQSSMDGYAILHSDVSESGTMLRLAGESKAGQADLPVVSAGTAVRIFTGAPVPEGATAVVMQENTSLSDRSVQIHEFPVAEGKNVRRAGQQIAQGAVALRAGALVSPGAVGFLKGMNVNEVTVYSKPKVGLLVTGDELLKAGEALVPGKIYESNSAMLQAALAQAGIGDFSISYASDDLDATIAALEVLLEEHDVILASGGISVGDYDFVGKALEALGAETIFYKVRQKPGKPLLFAKKEEKLIFALPGNPASSLVCYYEYVLPALKKIMGSREPFLRSVRLPLRDAYRFDGERDEFLKARVEGSEVVSLDGQESFVIGSFAVSNAIIYLPVGQNRVEAGELVEVHLLPF
ncbi:molybdopterin molybdenumtransferase MoeA [Dyadobacter endophyticus]|uniref:Molybdopterin molybdenumtransferase n=1 Tax=Dyadobacter endophyticus TaxID=1749036 RepID=A0ABQ1Z2A3_9BACT|nr:gephyrin-like molybdotransferase Glp [Dyadobacter endophyticus]GGH47040.1 molybdopterin molybdenumtransferase MoeA [Dyadobacter endophyticus]